MNGWMDVKWEKERGKFVMEEILATSWKQGGCGGGTG